ncbi:hypothetical protein TIFTF001_003621 [Ficus carica]|uniref:(S)-N-methylcoclaurine 3'-hydroxylase isozyme 2 n=1 Tax=Ficus carica TaxID=3494 RepID=A0AA87ZGM8_FICCA|nr:hypothetical protein TIFTF001_003621 [Ficus carica]
MAETLVMEVPNFLFPILLLLPVLYLILKHFKASKSPPIPPGPFSWPILGNLLQIGENPLATLTQFGQTYGPLFSLKLGSQRVVVASSSAVAMEILKTQDRLLCGRYVPHAAPAKSREHNGLSVAWIVECNETWKYLRTLCRSILFSSKAIESQVCVREERVRKMVKYIVSMEGKPLKVRDITFAMIFNMLGNIFLSVDLIDFEQESEAGGMSGVLRSVMEVVAAPNLSDLYPLLGQLDLQGLRKKSMEIYKKFCTMFEATIKERRERNRGDTQSQKDFLDALICNGSSDEQINMLLFELISAGTDTSSSTIEWAMTELIKNPKCMKIVQEELTREIIQDMVTESHLSKLPYLQACVKETLRLHPPAPFLLPRRAIESCQVMNYTIPKDSQVLVNVWAIGRDPKSWKDPLVFKPERFLDSSFDFKGNDFEFLPFGGGRRICAGMPMAAKHVPLVVASFIRFFDWSLPYGKDPNDLNMSAEYGITLMKEEPLILIPKVKS